VHLAKIVLAVLVHAGILYSPKIIIIETPHHKFHRLLEYNRPPG